MACVPLCKVNGAESKSRAKMVTRLTRGHFHKSGQAISAKRNLLRAKKLRFEGKIRETDCGSQSVSERSWAEII